MTPHTASAVTGLGTLADKLLCQPGPLVLMPGSSPGEPGWACSLLWALCPEPGAHCRAVCLRLGAGPQPSAPCVGTGRAPEGDLKESVLASGGTVQWRDGVPPSGAPCASAQFKETWGHRSPWEEDQAL